MFLRAKLVKDILILRPSKRRNLIQLLQRLGHTLSRRTNAAGLGNLLPDVQCLAFQIRILLDSTPNGLSRVKRLGQILKRKGFRNQLQNTANSSSRQRRAEGFLRRDALINHGFAKRAAAFLQRSGCVSAAERTILNAGSQLGRQLFLRHGFQRSIHGQAGDDIAEFSLSNLLNALVDAGF